MRRERGMAVWEIFIIMGFIAVFIPVVWNFSKVYEMKKRIDVTKERIKAIEKAVKVMYVSNVQFAEQNCFGWSDPVCAGLTLTPTPVGSQPTTTLNFATNNNLVYSILRNVGCNVNGTQVRCQDGWGSWMTFTLTNYHVPNSSYTAPYQGNFFRLTINYRTGAVDVAISKEIEWSLAQTNAKLSELATALKRFVRSRRLLELTNVCNTTGTSANDPAGGLGSWDDALVPWVWKVVSANPNTLCSGVETATGCGCSNHGSANNWEPSSQWTTVDTASEWGRVLSNLLLGINYRVDGFGNALDFVPLANSNGMPISSFPPQRPRPNYPVNNGLYKSRIGVLEAGVWYVYYDVVYE